MALPDVLPVLQFGACYGYSPSGICAASRSSRELCSAVKSADPGQLEDCARRVRDECARSPGMAGCFGDNPILVPVPASSPPAAGRLTVAERLVEMLLQQGLGGLAWAGLHRISPVARSSAARAGARPSVAAHYRSLAVEAGMPPSACILLIDDVVTRGRTLLAAATRMQQAYPDVPVRAFALLRTMSLTAEIRRLVDPCAGEIRWVRGDARRNP